MEPELAPSNRAIMTALPGIQEVASSGMRAEFGLNEKVR